MFKIQKFPGQFQIVHINIQLNSAYKSRKHLKLHIPYSYEWAHRSQRRHEITEAFCLNKTQQETNREASCGIIRKIERTLCRKLGISEATNGSMFYMRPVTFTTPTRCVLPNLHVTLKHLFPCSNTLVGFQIMFLIWG